MIGAGLAKVISKGLNLTNNHANYHNHNNNNNSNLNLNSSSSSFEVDMNNNNNNIYLNGSSAGPRQLLAQAAIFSQCEAWILFDLLLRARRLLNAAAIRKFVLKRRLKSRFIRSRQICKACKIQIKTLNEQIKIIKQEIKSFTIKQNKLGQNPLNPHYDHNNSTLNNNDKATAQPYNLGSWITSSKSSNDHSAVKNNHKNKGFAMNNQLNQSSLEVIKTLNNSLHDLRTIKKEFCLRLETNLRIAKVLKESIKFTSASSTSPNQIQTQTQTHIDQNKSIGFNHSDRSEESESVKACVKNQISLREPDEKEFGDIQSTSSQSICLSDSDNAFATSSTQSAPDMNSNSQVNILSSVSTVSGNGGASSTSHPDQQKLISIEDSISHQFDSYGHDSEHSGLRNKYPSSGDESGDKANHPMRASDIYSAWVASSSPPNISFGVGTTLPTVSNKNLDQLSILAGTGSGPSRELFPSEALANSFSARSSFKAESQMSKNNSDSPNSENLQLPINSSESRASYFHSPAQHHQSLWPDTESWVQHQIDEFEDHHLLYSVDHSPIESSSTLSQDKDGEDSFNTFETNHIFMDNLNAQNGQIENASVDNLNDQSLISPPPVPVSVSVQDSNNMHMSSSLNQEDSCILNANSDRKISLDAGEESLNDISGLSLDENESLDSFSFESILDLDDSSQNDIDQASDSDPEEDIDDDDNDLTIFLALTDEIDNSKRDVVSHQKADLPVSSEKTASSQFVDMNNSNGSNIDVWVAEGIRRLSVLRNAEVRLSNKMLAIREALTENQKSVIHAPKPDLSACSLHHFIHMMRHGKLQSTPETSSKQKHKHFSSLAESTVERSFINLVNGNNDLTTYRSHSAYVPAGLEELLRQQIMEHRHILLLIRQRIQARSAMRTLGLKSTVHPYSHPPKSPDGAFEVTGLIEWLFTVRVISSRSRGLLFIDMLIRAGLAELIPFRNSSHIPSPIFPLHLYECGCLTRCDGRAVSLSNLKDRLLRWTTPAEPIINKLDGIVAVALYDYVARAKDELTFAKGDKIFLIGEVDGWSLGRLEGKKTTGIFPSNFVQRIQNFSILKSSAPLNLVKPIQGNGGLQPSPEKKSNLQGLTDNTVDNNGFNSKYIIYNNNPLGDKTLLNLNQANSNPVISSIPFKSSKALALHSFSGTAPEDLQFHKGELITLSGFMDISDGWSHGYTNTHQGLFPLNYVIFADEFGRFISNGQTLACLSSPFTVHYDNPSFVPSLRLDPLAPRKSSSLRSNLHSSTPTYARLPSTPNNNIHSPGLSNSLVAYSSNSNLQESNEFESSLNSNNIAIALFDFKGNSRDELSFRKGDHLLVYRQIDGWSVGRIINESVTLNGHVNGFGTFPSNFVSFLHSSSKA